MGSTSASYPSPFVHACLSDWTTQTPLMCIKASLAPRSAVTSFCSREAEGTLCPLSADLSHQTCFDDFCTIYDLVSNKCLITNTFKTPFILHKDIIHLFPPHYLCDVCNILLSCSLRNVALGSVKPIHILDMQQTFNINCVQIKVKPVCRQMQNNGEASDALTNFTSRYVVVMVTWFHKSSGVTSPV